MRADWRGVVVLAVTLGLPGCGPGDLGLDLDWSLGPPTACLGLTEWEVHGFLDADVSEQAFLLPVGHSRELLVDSVPSFNVEGCDEAIASLQWLSTRPDVAGGFAPGASRRSVWLTGLSPGEAQISAQVTLTDGRTITAPLARGGRSYPVRVHAGPGPSAGRAVLIEGDVELEPEESSASPSTRAYLTFEVPAPGLLDMNVDWTSASNRVIAHMCAGAVSPPRGCVPIIDGNRSRGRKPVSGATPSSAGTHTLWITNEGPGAESVTYQVGLLPD